MSDSPTILFDALDLTNLHRNRGLFAGLLMTAALVLTEVFGVPQIADYIIVLAGSTGLQRYVQPFVRN